MIARRRLDLEHVDGRSGDVSVDDGRGQRVLVDDPTAGDVDQPRAAAHAAQLGGADDASRGVAERHVHGEDVRFGQECLEVAELGAGLVGALAGDQRVVGQHAHLQALAGDACHLEADLAEAEHAQRLVPQLQPLEARALPQPGAQ